MNEFKFLTKKLFLFFAALFFCSLAFAKNDLPKEILDITQVIYESEESSDGQWIFINAISAEDFANRLYSFDKETKKIRIIFEPAVESDLRFVWGMKFFEKTQKLYFMVHCGDFAANGKTDLFVQEGIHTAQKDDDGNYSAAGVWNQSAIQNWLFKNYWEAYIKRVTPPDYKNFFNILYSFADPGTNPIFVLQKDDGSFVFEKEAIDWILQNQKELWFTGLNYGSYFPLEKFLFARDADGKVLDKSAMTTIQRNPNNHENAGTIFTEANFAEANGNLYFASMVGSWKDLGLVSQEWVWNHSIIYQIQDDENGIRIFRPEEIKEIYAITCSFNTNAPYPIEGTKKGLLIRDIDEKTRWIYDGTTIQQYNTFTQIIKAKSTEFWLINLCIGLVLAILILLLLFHEFLNGNFSSVWQRKIIYRIQEEERNKISRDIHDSIVQDIRAIRINAEMLKVKDGYEQKQNELIEKITNCIVKMRNICYDLEPAEFSLPDPNTGKINIISILKTLTTQFETKSNIKCSLNTEGGLEEILVDKEKGQCLVRIIQEAFTNIEKHSYATEAQILIRKEKNGAKNFATLFIIDNGRGCDLEKEKKSKNWKTHFGLRTMKERAKTIGAEINFRSAPDDGMQIKLKMEI